MMSWEYIAGFFDGEGWVGMSMGVRRNCSNVRVRIVQTAERGRILLETIQAFIAKAGIKSSVRISPTGDDNRQILWVLEISSRDSTLRFLRMVMPFIHIKRTEAQDIIRYCTMFPIMAQSLRQMLAAEAGYVSKIGNDAVLEIRRRKLAGERTGVLAKEFGVDRHSISRIVRAVNFVNRTGG
jgi:intein/homing endonuclease